MGIYRAKDHESRQHGSLHLSFGLGIENDAVMAH